MTPYRTPDRWLLADGLLQATMQELAIDGGLHREGVAFFLGRHKDTVAHITHLCTLRGDKLDKTVDHLRIDPALMNEVTDLSIAEDLHLVGQIHSHGPGYGTDLSYPDHFYGIRVPGFLSLVAPDFAQRRETQLVECGVHVFETPGGFRRMPPGEISRRFGRLDNARHRVVVASV